MEAFFGTWQLVSTENLDQYMEALGVSPAMRKYFSNMKTTLIFSQDGDYIVLKFKMHEADNRSQTKRFKLGEEFEENTLDFRTCRAVYYLDEGKLVHVQKWDGKKVTVISEIQDRKLISVRTNKHFML
ncbi:Fatty acid-binding protein, brain [Bagarius yarrelli]|uniref:Fatty acid-binding protein, brain n=1 Tax=Bagarius yarrelli TaxID=175774 RepID=A0A556VWM3_BAGYA|nr:Fatty acid-binding protein, brain [Bagarius yarrelli]